MKYSPKNTDIKRTAVSPYLPFLNKVEDSVSLSVSEASLP